MHIQFDLQTVPEAREESDHEVCPPPKVVSSNVQNTTTEVKALFYLFFIIEISLHIFFVLHCVSHVKCSQPVSLCVQHHKQMLKIDGN